MDPRMHIERGLRAVRGPFGMHYVWRLEKNGRWNECGRFYDNAKPRCFPDECWVSMRTTAVSAAAGFMLDRIVYVWNEERI